MKNNGVKPLVIVGASGFGREVACIVEGINKVAKQWDFIGFVDDKLKGTTLEGYPILGSVSYLKNLKPKPYVVVAIGDSQIRYKVVCTIEDYKLNFATIIDPSVSLGANVSIGFGTIICKNSIITTNVKIGQHCIINNLCSIGHDSKICDFVSMMSRCGVAGDSYIGTGCYFGLASTVINGINIGEWSTFGAGAVVTNDIPSNVLAVGVPAKVIKTNYKK